MITGVFSGDSHVGFEVIDRPIKGSFYLIEGIPFQRIPLDAYLFRTRVGSGMRRNKSIGHLVRSDISLTL